jgi:spore germination protein KB
MGYGLGTTVWEGLQRTCTYSEVIFIAIIAGSMHGSRQIKKAAYISLAASALVICVCLLIFVLVLSYPVAQEQIAPVYMVSRQIYIGDFFKRLDPLFLYLWFSTSIITAAAEFYFGISVYCKAFRLQNHRPLILPAAVIVFIVSLIPKDFMMVNNALLFIRTYGIFVVFLIPMIAFAASLLHRKKAAA